MQVLILREPAASSLCPFYFRYFSSFLLGWHDDDLHFAVVLRLLPASGRGNTVMVGNVALSILLPGGIRYVILPAITLALTNVATMLRLTRSGILENMRQDYIKFARAKGVPAKSILFGHALKNALIPVVTIFGMDLGNMIAFTTITETILHGLAWAKAAY